MKEHCSKQSMSDRISRRWQETTLLPNHVCGVDNGMGVLTICVNSNRFEAGRLAQLSTMSSAA